jgi:hypothetical protein
MSMEDHSLPGCAAGHPHREILHAGIRTLSPKECLLASLSTSLTYPSMFIPYDVAHRYPYEPVRLVALWAVHRRRCEPHHMRVKANLSHGRPIL